MHIHGPSSDHLNQGGSNADGQHEQADLPFPEGRAEA